MLARSGRLPASGDYASEVKWDGFQAIVSTEGPLRVRSRRGWDMTERVPFLAQLPVRAADAGGVRRRRGAMEGRLRARTRGRRREGAP
jgi:ATP-dependent DNA ligase